MRSSRMFAVLVALGLYLTLRGYHSRDGDQAYRLPLLLHMQDASVYAADPFVRAFDVFNPHRGSLALLDGLSRITGLSAALFLLFCGTFVLTAFAIDKLARAVWPESGPRIGYIALALVLIAKAGNLGTNHLFEAMLLDRLLALALGWWAIAGFVANPSKSRILSALMIAAAAFVHPSFGLQIGFLMATGWLFCVAAGKQVAIDRQTAVCGFFITVLALVPSFWMVAAQGGHLFEGLSPSEFLALSASVQSPQHMLPHHWREPQWLAAGCYLIGATIALSAPVANREGRRRLVLLLAITLVGLAVATVAIEVFHSMRITIFQPFRVAMISRGLCLVLMAGHMRRLWVSGDALSRMRAALLVVGLAGDWSFVVATMFDVSAVVLGRISRRVQVVGSTLVLCGGLYFLWKHDTESGHWLLLAALGSVWVLRMLIGQSRSPHPLPLPINGHADHAKRNRAAAIFALAWLIPIAAMIVPNISEGRLAQRLAVHCRFGEWADGDVERLALWCRQNTPRDARFIGPPGPKTFRLWSRRELAFNRAASPYHAAGLADWSRRFRDHVGFEGSIDEFAAAYLKDRLKLEHGFDRLSAEQLSLLATKEGAGYVLATSKIAVGDFLERLKTEGRFAIYRVVPGSHGSVRIVVSKPRR